MWITAGVLVVLIIIAGVTGGESSDNESEDAAPKTSQPVPTENTAPKADSPSSPTERPAPAATETPTPRTSAPPATTTRTERARTPGQANAIRAAQQYLSISGFSRTGLISQLEFEGYSTADATYAVDHLDIDWNEQAVRSAETYMDVMPFSQSGLAEQLEFDGYTPAQAAHGAASQF